MTARERLLPLLIRPPATEGPEPWLDMIDTRPGRTGRLQALWQNTGGAGLYDAAVSAGSSLHTWIPDALGGRALRSFYGVADRLGLRGGETVLDLACGPGTLTRRLTDAVGSHGLVVAADLSVAMLERAVRAVRAGNVAFVRADAMDLPLRDGTVDALSCSLCLHLVPDVDTALTGIARVLAPGGRLAVTVPAHPRGPLRLATEALADGGQAHLFEPGELADLLIRHGFTEIRDRSWPAVQMVDAVTPALSGSP